MDSWNTGSGIRDLANPLFKRKLSHWKGTGAMSNIEIHILNVFGYSCEWLGIALVGFFPTRRLLMSGKLRPAVLQMWLLFFLWSVAVCFIFPVAAAYIFHDKRAYACFPEAIGIVPVAALGWVPALIICGGVWLVRNSIKRRRSQ
jgi:hypothetical protein